jgi:hypothetical protein
MTVAAKIKYPNRYDIVGSFLRPEKLKRARDAYHAHQISRDALTQVENSEINRLVKKRSNWAWLTWPQVNFGGAGGIWTSWTV